MHLAVDLLHQTLALLAVARLLSLLLRLLLRLYFCRLLLFNLILQALDQFVGMCGLCLLRLRLGVQGVWLLESLLRSLELGPRLHFL